MSIESLRYDLQETLRYQLPDKTWEYLARRYVGLYLKRKIGFKQLAEEAKSLLELSGESAPPGPLVSFGPVQARPRAVRQEVISDILAKNAETDSGVVAFRKRFLGGKLISFDRVEEWVKAQSEEDGEPSIWLKIPVPDSHIVTGPKDFGIDPPWSISSLENTPFELSRTVLQYAIPKSEYVQNMQTAANGVLETLRTLSERLAQRYSWSPAWATVFVLTGKAPPAFSVSYQQQRKTLAVAARVVLTIDPTVDPKDLAASYRRVRRELLGGRYRALSEKHIRLAQFTASRPGGEKWGTRMAAWNRKWKKQRTGWQYDSEKNFTRDYHQALRRLLGQGFNASTL